MLDAPVETLFVGFEKPPEQSLHAFVCRQCADERRGKGFLALTRDGKLRGEVVVYGRRLPVVVVTCFNQHDILIGISTLECVERRVELAQIAMVIGIIAQSDDVVVYTIACHALIEVF